MVLNMTGRERKYSALLVAWGLAGAVLQFVAASAWGLMGCAWATAFCGIGWNVSATAVCWRDVGIPPVSLASLRQLLAGIIPPPTDERSGRS
jgi:hypothetical protein